MIKNGKSRKRCRESISEYPVWKQPVFKERHDCFLLLFSIREKFANTLRIYYVLPENMDACKSFLDHRLKCLVPAKDTFFSRICLFTFEKHALQDPLRHLLYSYLPSPHLMTLTLSFLPAGVTQLYLLMKQEFSLLPGGGWVDSVEPVCCLGDLDIIKREIPLLSFKNVPPHMSIHFTIDGPSISNELRQELHDLFPIKDKPDSFYHLLYPSLCALGDGELRSYLCLRLCEVDFDLFVQMQWL